MSSVKMPDCRDCGAFLQEVRIGSETMFRCPWAKAGMQRVDGHQPVKRVYCKRKTDTLRVIGGIRVESVQ